MRTRSIQSMDTTAQPLRPLDTDAEIEALPSLTVDEVTLLDDLALRGTGTTCPPAVLVGVRQILAARGITG